MSVVVAVHAFATLCMVGLIWFVQVVHYPLFARVGTAEFAAYAVEHQRRTTWVVAPLMLVELATAVLLVTGPPPGAPAWLTWSGLALLAAAWLSTALLQVPAHARLAAGLDLPTCRRLVATNWIRTAVWSGRGVIAVALAARAAW